MIFFRTPQKPLQALLERISNKVSGFCREMNCAFYIEVNNKKREISSFKFNSFLLFCLITFIISLYKWLHTKTSSPSISQPMHSPTLGKLLWFWETVPSWECGTHQQDLNFKPIPSNTPSGFRGIQSCFSNFVLIPDNWPQLSSSSQSWNRMGKSPDGKISNKTEPYPSKPVAVSFWPRDNSKPNTNKKFKTPNPRKSIQQNREI